MKKIVFLIIVLLGISLVKVNAQYVRVKPGFSVNLSIGSHGNPPYHGAVWVDPQWTWRNGHYVEVPGYWAKPAHKNSIWMSGRWTFTKNRGYRWHNGYWK